MMEEDRLLKIKEVAALVTFSARKIWRDVSAKVFPRPSSWDRKQLVGGNRKFSDSYAATGKRNNFKNDYDN